jgi:hypothetical protein
VAVCTKTPWLPLDGKTPRGVKVLLLTEHGVAIIGQHPTSGTIGWHPLPYVPDELKNDSYHRLRMKR